MLTTLYPLLYPFPKNHSQSHIFSRLVESPSGHQTLKKPTFKSVFLCLRFGI